jgi:hypothetical protein
MQVYRFVMVVCFMDDTNTWVVFPPHMFVNILQAGPACICRYNAKIIKHIPLSPLEQVSLYTSGRRDSFQKLLTKIITWEKSNICHLINKHVYGKFRVLYCIPLGVWLYTELNKPTVLLVCEKSEIKTDTQKNFCIYSLICFPTAFFNFVISLHINREWNIVYVP